MKKRFIFPSLLLGTLLALPGANAAEIFDVNPEKWTNPAGTNLGQVIGLDLNGKVKTQGVWTNAQPDLQGGWTTTWGTEDKTITGSGNTFNVGLVEIDMSTVPLYAIGINANDHTGTYNLEGVKITNSASSGSNYFVTTGVAIGTTEGNYFAGKLNIEDVTITQQNIGNEIYGVKLGDNGIAEGANVYVKNINIDGKGGNIGVEVGDIQTGGVLQIDSVTVNSTDAYASAVHGFTGLMEESDGTGGSGKIIVGEATITGKTDVAAVTFNGSGDTGEALFNSNIQVELGKVKVTATGNDAKTVAVGVRGNDVKNVILKGDMTITNAQNSTEAYGVYAGKADVKIDGNVKIDAAGGAFVTASKTIDLGGTEPDQIITGGDLNLTLTEGSVLDTTASGVESAKDFNISGGTFNSGTIEAQNGTFTANNTVVNISAASLDGSQTSATVLNNAKVNITKGAMSDADFATAAANLGDVELNGKSTVYVDTFQQVDFSGANPTIKDADSIGITGGAVNAVRMHQNYTTWNAVSSHLLNGLDNRSGYRGQECDPCDPIGACDPCGSFGSTVARTAWINYVARDNEYEDLYQGVWDFDAEGVQFGTDLYRTKRGQLGVLFGYEDGRMRNIDGGGRVDNENFYIGLYGSRIFRNGWDVRGSFSYGWQDYDMQRRDSNVLTDWFGSSYNGNTSESTLELGKRLFRGNWSLRPVIGLDVYTNNTDGSAETQIAGTTGTAMTYAKNNLTQVFLRTGADLNWQRKRLGLNAGLFYAYDLHGQNLDTYVTSGAGSGNLGSTNLGRELLTWTVGGSIAVAKNFDVFMGYRGESYVDDDIDGDGVTNTGYVGASWKW